MARPGLMTHPKFRRLVYTLQEPVPHVVGYLEVMWQVAYEYGNSLLGDATDVELAAQYPGEPGKLAKALYLCGFIDEEDGEYHIHDLLDHAPDYVKKRHERELQRGERKANGREGHHHRRERTARWRRSEDNGGQCPPNGAERQTSASVGEHPLPSPPLPSQQQQQQDPACEETGSGTDPPAAAAADDSVELMEALVARGLSSTLAKRRVKQTADPALIREILVFYDAQTATFRNPVGSLLSMLKKPEEWGFERTDTGWQGPRDGQAKPKAETTKDRLARVEREKAARLKAEADVKPPTEDEMAKFREQWKQPAAKSKPGQA